MVLADLSASPAAIAELFIDDWEKDSHFTAFFDHRI